MARKVQACESVAAHFWHLTLWLQLDLVY